MDALEYLKLHGEEHCDAVAKGAGTTLVYFKQIAYRHRLPSVKVARNLERETDGALNAADLVFIELKRPAATNGAPEPAPT
jgi:hypothetical protein